MAQVKELVEQAINSELLDEINQKTPKTIIMSEVYKRTLKDILKAHEETIKTYADIIQKLGYEHKAEKDKKDKVIKELEIISNNRGKELDNHIVENIKLKKELDKKDKEINSLKEQLDMAHNFNQSLGNENQELKNKPKLFKEDFDEYNIYDVLRNDRKAYALKDNSKYELLDSKEDKDVS